MIKFIEDTHQYFYGDIEFDSVSHVIKQLEAKEDWDKIARDYAKKNGQNAQYWKDKWEQKKKLGTEAGTILHKIEEEKTISTEENVICCEFDGTCKIAIPIINLKNNTVYPELMIYDIDAEVCGQSDKVTVKNGVIHIWDLKTDKSIETSSYRNPYTGLTKKLLPPCEHLDACNYNIYSLKMSMYMYMLWKQNKRFEVGDITIEHFSIKRDEEGIPILENGVPIVLSKKIYKLPYREKEVKKILNDRKALRKSRK